MATREQARIVEGNGREPEVVLPSGRPVPLCEPPALFGPTTEALARIQRVRGRPLFVLIADFIDEYVYDEVYRWKRLLRAAGEGNNLDVLIHSPGGSLSECYRIARLLAHYTDEWQALVPRLAMSGATLISLGSSKIVLPPGAQLGPLDPQVISKRRTKFFIGERQSPLEAFKAVTYLREFALRTLETSMYYLYREQRVAPHLALETASKLAVELAEPVLRNIEPYDLGAFALDSELASNYCRRLCVPSTGQKSTQRDVEYSALVERYPAHEFVIDIDEAAELGLNVEEPPEALDDLFDELAKHLGELVAYVGLIPAAEPATGDEEGKP